jgi:hypothetical protein
MAVELTPACEGRHQHDCATAKQCCEMAYFSQSQHKRFLAFLADTGRQKSAYVRELVMAEVAQWEKRKLQKALILHELRSRGFTDTQLDAL